MYANETLLELTIYINIGNTPKADFVFFFNCHYVQTFVLSYADIQLICYQFITWRLTVLLCVPFHIASNPCLYVTDNQ